VTDLQPDVDEVLQTEADDEKPYIPPLCVKEIQAPVRVQELPRKSGSTRTLTVTDTPRRVLTADHRRASVQLRALDLDKAVAYSLNESSAQELSSMSELPGLEADRITATTELWVRAVTGTARISITTENWADGR
jgi:hypothetical protein